MKMRGMAVIMFFVLLLRPSLAGEPVWILIETQPPGAEIRDHAGNFLKRSGDKFAIDLTRYGEQPSLDLHIHLDGFEPHKLTLRGQDFTEARTTGNPIKKSVTLAPTSVLVAIRYSIQGHPYASGLSGGVLMLGFVFWRRRQKGLIAQAARSERLDVLESKVLTRDSFTMEVVGGYRLVNTLGRGGMATVYQGVPDATLEPDEAVAVKVMDRKLASQEVAVQRFRREIKAYQKLHHPNIVALMDWGEDQERGIVYLVQEFVSGQTVRSLLQDQRPDIKQVISIVEGVVAGLSHAHGQGFVHRDLKPENIMVTADGRIKVMDFGLAKTVDAGKLTATGTALGTPAYMAPEQIQAGELSPHIDQYALGCLAYELLVGEPPFLADDPIHLIFLHVSEEPMPPSRHRTLPASVDEVIIKTLSKLPQERYSSLAEAGSALLEALGEI